MSPLIKDPILRVTATEVLLRDLLEAKAAVDRSKAKHRPALTGLSSLIVQISSARALAERQQAVAAGDHVEGS